MYKNELTLSKKIETVHLYCLDKTKFWGIWLFTQYFFDSLSYKCACFQSNPIKHMLPIRTKWTFSVCGVFQLSGQCSQVLKSLGSTQLEQTSFHFSRCLSSTHTISENDQFCMADFCYTGNWNHIATDYVKFWAKCHVYEFWKFICSSNQVRSILK